MSDDLCWPDGDHTPSSYTRRKKMRLFKVKAQMFESRATARVFRDELIKGGTPAIINRGPDHWRGETDGTSVQMEKQIR